MDQKLALVRMLRSKRKELNLKKSAGIQIREMGNDCRPATGVELQGINPNGNNKQVEWEVGWYR